MTDDEPPHGVTLLGAAAAAADIATEALDAAVATLPPSHVPASLRARFELRDPHRGLALSEVLTAAVVIEASGHEVATTFWQHLGRCADALHERRLADYAAGRANGWPRRTLSDVLATFVMLERWIPADVLADVATTAQQLRSILAAVRVRVELTDDAWANASFDALTAAFAPCVGADADWLDSEGLADACYDLYDWLPTLDVSGDRAALFTLCVWTLLEYQVRELQLTD